jgi:hypothetical protein
MMDACVPTRVVPVKRVSLPVPTGHQQTQQLFGLLSMEEKKT